MRDNTKNTLTGLADAWSDPGAGNRLAGLARLSTLLDEMISSEVLEARHVGATWAEIGAALGITKQAAQQRFSRPPGVSSLH